MKAEDWIKVTNKLPEYEELVLVAGLFDGVGDVEAWFSHRSESDEVLRDKNHFCIYHNSARITHWMPVVLPPTCKNCIWCVDNKLDKGTYFCQWINRNHHKIVKIELNKDICEHFDVVSLSLTEK